MLILPTPIADYVAATNAHAAEQLAACFQHDATVHDEQRVWQGRADIAAWASETAERYRATMAPLAISSVDGQQHLRAAVSGNFPGSPVNLVFRFTLEGQAIAALEITP